jgi:hypothetical protein
MSENLTITVALDGEGKRLLRDLIKCLHLLADPPSKSQTYPRNDRDAVVKALRKAQDRYGNAAFDIGPTTSWSQVADIIGMVVNLANKWQALCRGIEDNVDLIAVMNSFDKEPS